MASLKEMHQAHQTRLTVMSNQLDSKYEHRITQLLEQINASELQEVRSIFTMVRCLTYDCRLFVYLETN
jgi:hypothetical protein